MIRAHKVPGILVLIFACLSLAGASAQKFKVATVDMSVLIREFHRFKAAQAEKDFEVETIRKEDKGRLQRIKAIADELERMVKEIKDPSLSQNKREAVGQMVRSKEADLQALERERQVFLETSDKSLAQKMETLQSQITQTVMDTVNEYAATQDVDFVFDESGISRSEVPFLIYVRNRIDLTEAVLKILNKDAPVQEETKAPNPGE